jgi:hypothetical protein
VFPQKKIIALECIIFSNSEPIVNSANSLGFSNYGVTKVSMVGTGAGRGMEGALALFWAFPQSEHDK